MSATLFIGGAVWAGTGLESDALLVVDGVVRALGEQAREQASGIDCKTVDLDGGFLMPSFGDGHAHPLYGGLEAAGPAVRPCTSINRTATGKRSCVALSTRAPSFPCPGKCRYPCAANWLLVATKIR